MQTLGHAVSISMQPRPVIIQDFSPHLPLGSRHCGYLNKYLHVCYCGFERAPTDQRADPTTGTAGVLNDPIRPSMVDLFPHSAESALLANSSSRPKHSGTLLYPRHESALSRCRGGHPDHHGFHTLFLDMFDSELCCGAQDRRASANHTR